VKDLLALIGEAEEFFRPPGRDNETAEFFARIVHLAEEPGLAELRDELRDRSLMMIATKMRQRVDSRTATGKLVSSLLGPPSNWPAPVASDAQFAVKTALTR
jgi:hypothetical protein